MSNFSILETGFLRGKQLRLFSWKNPHIYYQSPLSDEETLSIGDDEYVRVTPDSKFIFLNGVNQCEGFQVKIKIDGRSLIFPKMKVLGKDLIGDKPLYCEGVEIKEDMKLVLQKGDKFTTSAYEPREKTTVPAHGFVLQDKSDIINSNATKFIMPTESLQDKPDPYIPINVKSSPEATELQNIHTYKHEMAIAELNSQTQIEIANIIANAQISIAKIHASKPSKSN